MLTHITHCPVLLAAACSSQADGNGNLAAREWQQWESWQFQPSTPYITAQQGACGVVPVSG